MLNSIFTKKGDEKSDRIFYTITKKMTHTDLPINYPKTKKIDGLEQHKRFDTKIYMNAASFYGIITHKSKNLHS